MTKEEAVEIVSYVKDNVVEAGPSCEYGQKEIEEALDILLYEVANHSIPAGLDEAAKEYGKRQGLEEKPYAIKHFKAGAEWMAGQGISFEEEACSLYDNGEPAGYGFYDTSIFECKEHPSDHEIISNLSLKDGDKVIIQIRKA